MVIQGERVLEMPFHKIYSDMELSPGNNGALHFDWNRIIYVSDCLDYRDAEVRMLLERGVGCHGTTGPAMSFCVPLLYCVHGTQGC